MQNTPAPEAWSSTMSPELSFFCKKTARVWEEILRANRGELTQGSLPPLMGLGPRIPVKALPFVMQGRLIRAFLGPDLNMVTIVLNQARNRIIFFAAERTEDGKYVEMIRLDEHFPQEFGHEICKALQIGEEANAFSLIHHALEENGLSRFKPGLLKISDLTFFEAFMELEQRKSQPLQYIPACARVAHRVITKRLLYFYPQIPLERILRLSRLLLPRPTLPG